MNRVISSKVPVLLCANPCMTGHLKYINRTHFCQSEYHKIPDYSPSIRHAYMTEWLITHKNSQIRIPEGCKGGPLPSSLEPEASDERMRARGATLTRSRLRGKFMHGQLSRGRGGQPRFAMWKCTLKKWCKLNLLMAGNRPLYQWKFMRVCGMTSY